MCAQLLGSLAFAGHHVTACMNAVVLCVAGCVSVLLDSFGCYYC